MPVNSSRFNRFFVLLLLQFASFASADTQLPTLTPAQLNWLGEQIFSNECAREPDCLTGWNQGEEFPSLGIGHFIWFPAGQQAPFEETFPALIQFLGDEGVAIPQWLSTAVQTGAPWPDRATFYAEFDSPKMGQLRRFLYETRDLQARFIARRLGQTVPRLMAASAVNQDSIERHFNAVAAASPPHGLYALIDYLHFKGSGLHHAERYQGQGWGLLQVLEQMPDTAAPLPAFIASAEQVLRQRVANSPAERDETRWIRGWIARLQTYRPAALTP